MRAQSDAEFREAVEEANELHVTADVFARQIEPEPAPEDQVDWTMAEASDDEDDAPMELIDMQPAPASAPLMSRLERCIALRLVCVALDRVDASPKNATCLISRRLSLCCLTCRLSRVSWPAHVFPCLNYQSQAPRQ